MDKKWYYSKTVWVNIISLIVVIINEKTKLNIITPEIEVYLLAFINLILRTISHENIVWK